MIFLIDIFHSVLRSNRRSASVFADLRRVCSWSDEVRYVSAGKSYRMHINSLCSVVVAAAACELFASLVMLVAPMVWSVLRAA